MNLIEKALAGNKSYTAKKTEEHLVIIKNVRPLLKDDRRVIIDTDKGTFFGFRSVFGSDIAISSIPSNTKATLTLQEGKDEQYANVVSVKIDSNSQSAKELVVTNRLAVKLD